MITVQEAIDRIQATAISFPTIDLPLDQSLGYVLREPVLADRDFPPYDRVTMDGIAFRYESWREDFAFPVQSIQQAGEAQQSLQEAHNCIEVMTGAVCPAGADTVIRYEDIVFEEDNGHRYARLTVAPEKAGQNIHNQGSDRKKNSTLIQPGRIITAAEIASAATVGMVKLRVSKPARIAIISTGDELVEVDQSPLPHQIRTSNSYMLQAALQDLALEAERFHIVDQPASIEARLRELLVQFDVLVLSGGVSMGKADYLPSSLAALGVEKLFHKVRQRPGKPFWFGRHPEGTVVFALPGNPVSSFVSCIKYIRPWLYSCMQITPAPPLFASLAQDFSFKPELTYFLQVKAYSGPGGQLLARPVPGKGSGDLANLIDSNAFLELPSDRIDFKAGESYPLIPFRRL